ncbi:hypothetical protein [Roseobacter sp.]|uniref:hypothetical protein n=1 Tax=Roseobacter sp. TaxID=1907202 RepID=UPI0032971AE2
MNAKTTALLQIGDADACRQPQPRTGVFISKMKPFKQLEDPLVVCRGNPNPIVRNNNLHTIAIG